MKIKILIVLIGMTVSVFAQNSYSETGALSARDVKTEKFKVYGNCGMCETRIEKAVKAIDGVSAADWDKKTKMIEVTFDDSKTSLDTIHQAIADAGHDTDLKKAEDKTYEDLPGCCHYERPEKKK